MYGLDPGYRSLLRALHTAEASGIHGSLRLHMQRIRGDVRLQQLSLSVHLYFRTPMMNWDMAPYVVNSVVGVISAQHTACDSIRDTCMVLGFVTGSFWGMAAVCFPIMLPLAQAAGRKYVSDYRCSYSRSCSRKHDMLLRRLSDPVLHALEDTEQRLPEDRHYRWLLPAIIVSMVIYLYCRLRALDVILFMGGSSRCSPLTADKGNRRGRKSI